MNSNKNMGENNIILEISDQYYNMKDKIEPVKHIVDIAYEAMKDLNIEPIIQPIRGGTDGSQLSFMDYQHQIFLQVEKTSMGNMNIFQ